MASSLQQLYSEVILEHSRDPHGFGLNDHLDTTSHQVNPMCGDEVTLGVRLRAGKDNVEVVDIAWEGKGCSISMAATSVLVEELIGEPISTARSAHERFKELMHARGAELDADTVEELGDLAAFSGVAKYPARIKCALLGWMALHDALERAHSGLETHEA